MFDVIRCKRTVDGILEKMPSRTRDVLSRRFCIGKNVQNFKTEGETLEKIGKDYGVTRERVRQIEKRGLEMFQNSSEFSNLKRPLFEIKRFIDNQGGLKREDILKSSLVSDISLHPYLFFLLKIGEQFSYQPESDLFYAFWMTKKESLEIAEKINNFLAELIEKRGQLLAEEEILEIGKREALNLLSTTLKVNIELKGSHLLSYIEITKKIERNPFNEYGLSHWPEVNPKGARDRAYLVLKKEGRPLHFRELAKLIEEKLQTPVEPGTLHNELIKNQNFILVGRGTYALREWGYKDGTVRDVIKELLKEKGPLLREEIIKEVKKQRMVKESTIVLNLQYFKKTKDGKYTL